MSGYQISRRQFRLSQAVRRAIDAVTIPVPQEISKNAIVFTCLLATGPNLWPGFEYHRGRDSDHNFPGSLPGKEHFDRAPFINLGCARGKSRFQRLDGSNSTNRRKIGNRPMRIFRHSLEC